MLLVSLRAYLTLVIILLRFLLNARLDPVLRPPTVCAEQIRPVENKLELWAYGMDGEQFLGCEHCLVLSALHSHLLSPQLCFDSIGCCLCRMYTVEVFFLFCLEWLREIRTFLCAPSANFV